MIDSTGYNPPQSTETSSIVEHKTQIPQLDLRRHGKEKVSEVFVTLMPREVVIAGRMRSMSYTELVTCIYFKDKIC